MPANFGPVFAALYDALDVLNAIDPNKLDEDSQDRRDAELEAIQDLLANAHTVALANLTGEGAKLANQFKAETRRLDDTLAKLKTDLARIKAISDSVSKLAGILKELLPLIGG